MEKKRKRRRAYARAYYRMALLALAAMVTARLVMLMIDVIQLQIKNAGAFSIPVYAAILVFTGWELKTWTGQGKEKKIMWTYKCDHCGAALDPGERCDCQDRPTEYNGKPIFTQENFNYSKAEIGDYVEQAVVDDAMDCLPPASMSARCAQMGEPYSHREDPETGRFRPTYYTFKKVAGEWPNGIWQFCGCCFQGETVPRGKDPVYC